MFKSFFKFFLLMLTLLSIACVSKAAEEIKGVQTKLFELGFDPGIVDGIWGNKTKTALEKFMQQKGSKFDGYLDENEFALLGLQTKPCQPKPHKVNGNYLAKSWSKEITCPAEVFAASDLKPSTKIAVQTTLKAAADEWGNYGPVEYWILGADKDAAINLAEKYCQRRAERKNFSYERCIKRETDKRDHGFISYYNIGATALKNDQPSGSAGHNGGMDWGIHQFTSSLPLGFENKLGIPGAEEQKTVMHEYFHAVQHAHLRTLDRNERDKLLGPVWFMEGGAEYMASVYHYKLTRQNKLPRLRNGKWQFKFREQMERKFKRSKEINQKLDCVSKMAKATYDSPCREFFYEAGAWAVAYLLDKTNQHIFLERFYPNLEKLGWEAAFKVSFGIGSLDFYDEFRDFMKVNPSQAMKILPQY